MQALEVISINLWQVLISLLNLGVLFLLFKWLMYKPVKRTMEARKVAIDEQYRAAEEAERAAFASRDEYARKLAGAQAEADSLIHEATASASRRSDRIVAEARDKADAIVRQGQAEAAMELKKAQDSIRQEITDVSAALTEKLLNREVNTQDHRGLINSFLQEMGDEQ